MKTVQRNGNSYRLPGTLNEFQEELYIHLINWKRAQGITDSGEYKNTPYDAILPDRYAAAGEMPHIYAPIKGRLDGHRAKNPFRIHKFFYHMASSQAANINLFLPILEHPLADRVLASIKPDLACVDRGELDNGYCFEYWGGNFDPQAGKGPLGDKSTRAGTDADLAIAYRDHEGTSCLWLIEHKLTESEFTVCGGSSSDGRQPDHDCDKSFSAILAKMDACYYHQVKKYRYWELSEEHQTVFSHHSEYEHCPFRGGMNQLWRNQLLALAIEDKGQPFKHAHFSVVRHPENTYLDKTLNAYRTLIDNNPKFSAFTSADVIGVAERHADESLQKWTAWYKELYRV